MMKWQEIESQVMSEPENFPAGISENDKSRYLQLEVEARFNDHHGINQGHNENIKDLKHQIIAKYIN